MFLRPLRRFLLPLALLLSAADAAERPNVIFILTDDLGFGDLGVYYQNSRNFEENRHLPAMRSPHLDRFAAEGLRMDRHYCPAPVCAPSRASFLRGVHPGHADDRDNQFDKELADQHTVGTVMRQAGYATAVIGKWGLQGGDGFPGHPQRRGFDTFFGYIAHLHAHYHYPKELGQPFYDGYEDISAALDGCYSTDLTTARAKRWIADHRAEHAERPFFLFLTYAAPHARLEVPTGPYPEGRGLHGGVQWTGTPGAMINTAGGTVDSFIHPDYADATWDHDQDPATPEVAWPMTARRHATMIRRIDDAIDDLLGLLDDLGIDDQTLVVFTSDNGPHNESGANGGAIGAQDPRFFRTYGPLDGIKRDVWEGGIRVPTLVRWPDGIPAGGVSERPSQFHDWMATFADLAGLPTPFASDGVSLLPELRGAGERREGVVYVEYTNGGAASTPDYADFHPSHVTTRGHMQALMLDERLKAVRYQTTAADSPFRIYDVAADPQETTDLAGRPGMPGQDELLARTLRLRRSGGGVSRPYDGVAVPAVASGPLRPGIRHEIHHGNFPHVPDFRDMEAARQGSSDPLEITRLRDGRAGGLALHGFLHVAAEGEYTFFLRCDGGAFVRLHQARLIDADFGYEAGSERSSGSIRLAAGLHPIRIHTRHPAGGTPQFELEWEGPGFPRQPVPAAAFLFEDTPGGS